MLPMKEIFTSVINAGLYGATCPFMCIALMEAEEFGLITEEEYDQTSGKLRSTIQNASTMISYIFENHREIYDSFPCELSTASFAETYHKHIYLNWDKFEEYIYLKTQPNVTEEYRLWFIKEHFKFQSLV